MERRARRRSPGGAGSPGFDRVIAVDWSANARPKSGRDSIWIAATNGDGVRLDNPPTRAGSEALIERLLVEEPTASTLMVVDFSLGYPRGTAGALGLEGAPWQATWEELATRIIDDDANRNNRFAVAGEMNAIVSGSPAPFWGCPPAQRSSTLHSTKPAQQGPLPQWRVVEDVLRAQGYRPFSSWQLLGAGAVGGQSLLGIPMIRRLVARLDGRAVVWPFDTGLDAPAVSGGVVVIAEAWPSMFVIDERATSRGATAPDVRDARQVATVARRLHERGAAGVLATAFAPAVPAGSELAVVDEEGWILGVGDPMFDVAVAGCQRSVS